MDEWCVRASAPPHTGRNAADLIPRANVGRRCSWRGLCCIENAISFMRMKQLGSMVRELAARVARAMETIVASTVLRGTDATGADAASAV